MVRKSMMRWCATLLAVIALAAPGQVLSPTLVQASSQQVPLTTAPKIASSKLHGHWLHITDLHPDLYYREGANVNEACHRSASLPGQKQKRKHRKGNSVGHWGAAVSVCDSPKALVAATLDWIAENWNVNSKAPAGETVGRGLDFILITGDVARHDIDVNQPRSAEEIFEYNRWALRLFEEHFPSLPIVPNLGNNDIKPHNIMFPGPNAMTNTYAEIWKDHIPEDQQETFKKGGYFAKEVVPGQLAVISLNTLYWFNSNAAVRGCKGRKDPGRIQLDWLAKTLDGFRNAGMQVHLMGHVPPTSSSYFEHCYESYTETALHYQDTIVGQHFGHANVDAWYLQKATSSRKNARSPNRLTETSETSTDDYLPFFVAPSIVPTYLPSLRIWTYNVSRAQEPQESLLRQTSSDIKEESIAGTQHRSFTRADSARFVSPDSPARHNTFLTPLGYSQWVLDLDRANKRYARERRQSKNHAGLEYQLEYTTYNAETLWSQYLQVEQEFQTHIPVPRHLLDRELSRLDASPPTLIHSGVTTHKVSVPKKVQHLTQYALSSCIVDEMLRWADGMVPCKKFLANHPSRLLPSFSRKRARVGFCRMKGGAYQWHNSAVE